MARGKKAAADVAPADEPWELPEGWRWERLGDLGEWYGGGTPSKAVAEYWANGDIPWISPKDMKRLDLEDTEDHITKEAVAGSSTRLVPAQSVVCVMRSGILKHSFPVAVTGRPMTLNQDLRAVHPRRDVAARYLAYFLRLSAQKILHECSKDGTTVDSIDAARLMQMPVPLPADVGRQWSIVERIDALFTEIDEGEAALAEAWADGETYRKALLKAAMTGELTADWRRQNLPHETGADVLRQFVAYRPDAGASRPTSQIKTDGMPELPEHWSWATLEELSAPEHGAISDGPFGSNLKSDHYRDFGPRVVRLQNIDKRGSFVDSKAHIDAEHFASLGRHHVRTGDLVVAILGDPLPRAAIVPPGVEPAMVKADCIKVRLASGVSRYFVWAWLNSPIVQGFFLNSIKGVGRPRISMPQLRTLPVPLPPANEVEEIVARLEEGLALTANMHLGHSAWTKQSNELRQSILAAAFRGELTA